MPGSGDELQRTVYVGNLDPTTTGDMIIQYFGKVMGIKRVLSFTLALAAN